LALVGLWAMPANAQELLTNASFDLTTPYSPNPAAPDNLAPQPASWTVIGNRTNTGPYTDVLASEPWAGPAPRPLQLRARATTMAPAPVAEAQTAVCSSSHSLATSILVTWLRVTCSKLFPALPA